jgi:DNA-binding XRE family transcriptional regulator
VRPYRYRPRGRDVQHVPPDEAGPAQPARVGRLTGPSPNLVTMGSATAGALRERRRELRLTQAELGAQVGLTQLQLSRIETGAVRPPDAVLERLSAALDVPKEALLPDARQQT